MQQKAEIDTEHLNLNLHLNANANAKPSALLKRQAAGAVRFFWGGFFVICYLLFGVPRGAPGSWQWSAAGGT
jgi:hypothetical protein